MPKPSDVKTIVEEPNLGVTALRAFPKETLIEAVLELKKIASDHLLRLKELEQQEKLMRLNFELNQSEMRDSLSRELFKLGEMMMDHKHGPYALDNVSKGLAAIWKAELPPSSKQNVESDPELSERVDKARSQGLRWNKADKQPERKSTVIKKLESWEAGVNRGLNSNPDLYVNTDYEQIVKTEGGEAFVVGLCEQVENSFGIGPMSKYLRTRFKRCMGKIPKPLPSPEKQEITNEEHAVELIKRTWSDSLSESLYADIKKHLILRLDKYGGVDKIPLKSFRSLCDAKSLPTFFEFPEKPDHPVDRLNEIKAGKYDQEFTDLLENYRSEVSEK